MDINPYQSPQQTEVREEDTRPKVEGALDISTLLWLLAGAIFFNLAILLALIWATGASFAAVGGFWQPFGIMAALAVFLALVGTLLRKR